MLVARSRVVLPLLGVAVITLGSGRVVAQTRHIVPDQFPEIQQAIDAASPGDIVVVRFRLSPWRSFSLSKPLTVVSWEQQYTEDTTIEVTGPADAIRVTLNPGEHARIVGFTISENRASPGGFSPVVVQGGIITFEDCDIAGGSDPTSVAGVAALEIHNARATFLRTQMFGGLNGLGLRAFDSEISGVAMWSFGGLNATGTWLQRARLHGSQCLLQGGDSGLQAGGTALLVDANSTCRLSDSQVLGGVGVVGGAGIVNASTTPVELARNQIEGGAGVGRGQAIIGPATPNANLLGVLEGRRAAKVGTLRLGESIAPLYVANPGDPIAATLSFGLMAPVSLPFLQGELWLAPPMLAAGTTVADPQGFGFGIMIPIPNDPALYDLAVWMQGVSGLTAPLAVSPVTGGVIRR